MNKFIKNLILICLIMLLFLKMPCFAELNTDILGKWKLIKNQDMEDKINLFDGDIRVINVKKNVNLYGEDFFYVIFDNEKHALSCFYSENIYWCAPFILKRLNITKDDKIKDIIDGRLDGYLLLKIDLLNNKKIIEIKFRPLTGKDDFSEKALFKSLPAYEKSI